MEGPMLITVYCNVCYFLICRIVPNCIPTEWANSLAIISNFKKEGRLRYIVLRELRVRPHFSSPEWINPKINRHALLQERHQCRSCYWSGGHGWQIQWGIIWLSLVRSYHIFRKECQQVAHALELAIRTLVSRLRFSTIGFRLWYWSLNSHNLCLEFFPSKFSSNRLKLQPKKKTTTTTMTITTLIK